MFLLNSRFYWFVVSILLLLATDLSAQEKKYLSSMVTLELGRNSVDTEETYVDLDLGFDNGMHVRSMLGQSQQTVEGQSQVSDSRLIGISSDYRTRFVAGFDFEYWGNKSTLETWTNRLKLGTNTDNWYVQVTYEDRQSRFYTTSTSSFFKNRQVPTSAEVDSTGTGLSASYYGVFPWALTLSYIGYSYASDPTVLSGQQNLPALTPSSNVDMPMELESWRRSADLSYSLNWGIVGLSGSQGESVLDKSIASNTAIYLIWNMRNDWSLTLTGGQSDTDNSSETINYSRVAVSHRW